MKTLILTVLLACSTSLDAAPASNRRVAGGMLLGIGIPLTVIGALGAGQPRDSNSLSPDFRTLGFGIAIGGMAATVGGAVLWVKGGEEPRAVVSLRF